MANNNANGNVALTCQDYCIRTAVLSAKISRLLATLSRTKENEKRVSTLIGECHCLDSDLDDWSRQLPDSFKWQTIIWKHDSARGDYSKSEVFPGRVDIYQDLCVCSLWNMMRCSRTILSSKILRCVAWLVHHTDYRTTVEYAASARVCETMIADIISSVPYQLGSLPAQRGLYAAANPILSSFACGEEDAEKSLAGILLIWPLACIQGLDFTTDAQRAWVKGRLQFIGQHLGLQYANVLTQV